MIIDLNAIRGSSKVFDVALAADEIAIDSDEMRICSPVSFSGEMSCDDVRTKVAGKIKTLLEHKCTRCLEEVPLTTELDVEVEFVDREHFSEGGEHEVEKGDLAVDVLQSELLDLHEIVREQLLLNLPEQVLCSPDCKGLCESCGTNRNEKDCDCSDAEIDPRWSALKNLK